VALTDLSVRDVTDEDILISHVCPRTCDSCQSSCEAQHADARWINNAWTPANNSWTPAAWQVEERVLMTSATLPTALTLLIAWVTSSIFMFVYSMAIDTILLCFCEDVRDGKPYFMPKSLKKFFKGAESKKSKKDRRKAKAGEGGDAKAEAPK